MSDQIKYCVNQLIRFSLMFKKKECDSPERSIQFGYTLGRLTILLKDIGQTNDIISKFDNYTIGMAHYSLKSGLIQYSDDSDLQFEYRMVDYGFALGVMQESLGQDHFVWWKPISNLLTEKKWSEASEIIRKSLLNQDIGEETEYDIFSDQILGPIDWDSTYQHIIDVEWYNNIIVENV